MPADWFPHAVEASNDDCVLCLLLERLATNYREEFCLGHFCPCHSLVTPNTLHTK